MYPLRPEGLLTIVLSILLLPVTQQFVLPPNPLIFRQLAPAGTVVGNIVLDREGESALGNHTLTLTGICETCVELTRLKLDGSVDIVTKTTPSSWSACSTSLTAAPAGTIPELRRCTATIHDRSLAGPETRSIEIYVNQAPTLSSIGEEINEILENEILNASQPIAVLTSTDPDVSARDFYTRTLTITSCSTNPLDCPFHLYQRSTSGNLNPCPANTSCTARTVTIQTYHIQQVQPLDYEKENVHIIRLRLTDAPGQDEILRNSVELSITIRVLDVQDTPPIFTEFPAFSQIDELSIIDTPVFSVKAIDGDTGVAKPNSLLFRICQFNDTTAEQSGMCMDTPHLRIKKNPDNTAEILVKRLFKVDDFTGGYIDFNITVTEIEDENLALLLNLDYLGDSTTRKFRVLVNDINDNPPIFLLAADPTQKETEVAVMEASIDENANIGATLEFRDRRLIRVRDPDRGLNAQFTLQIIGDPYAGIFELSSTLGQGDVYLTLRVKNATLLDAESISSFNLSIVAHETEPPSTERPDTTLLVIVNVLDVNDNPSFFTLCRDNSGQFELDVEETIFHGSNRTLNSLLDIGYATGNLSDADRDIENRNETRFRLQTFDQPSFAISTEGNFEVVGRLDYETTQIHPVIIGIENTGRNGATTMSRCNITITVLDVNDEIPEFASVNDGRSFNVSENIQDVEIGLVTATDRDATANLSFTIILDRADGPNGIQAPNFQLSDHIEISGIPPTEPSREWKGRILVKKQLDRELTETIQATIAVTDLNAANPASNVQTARIRVIIHVADVNDNAPVLTFRNSVVKDIITETVPELTVGNINLEFYAKDADSPPASGVMVFWPVLEDIPPEYTDHIKVAENSDDTGLIQVIIQKQFYYDRVQNLTFKLVVYDNDPTESSLVTMNTTVVILLNITDKNNLDPRIIYPDNYDPANNTAMVFTVLETDMRNNKPEDFVPFPVLQVEAVDDDSDLFLPLHYYLAMGTSTELQGKLAINISTGLVSVVQPLDREAPGMSRVLTLQLQVKDNAYQSFDQRTSSITTFAIRILDINDNAPVFPSPSSAESNGFAVTLLEKDEVGMILPFGNIRATDRDLPDGCGKIHYSIVPPNAAVSIDSNTAALTLLEKLTLDIQFTIQADDSLISGCAPGHKVLSPVMTVKIMPTELLYEIVVNLEMTNQTLRNITFNLLQDELRYIAANGGYEYVFHSIQSPLTRAAAPQVINFSFLNKTNKLDAAPKGDIERLLTAKVDKLKELGVTSIGSGNVPQGPKTEEGFDQNIIVIIVVAGLAFVLLITTAVFFVEKRKLMRKLRVYKASQGKGQAGHEMVAAETTFSPYAAAAIVKKNPILEMYGDNLDSGVSRRLSITEKQTDDSLDKEEDEPSDSETSSQNDGGEDILDPEAAAAQTNRQNIQAQLRKSAFR